MPQRNNPNQPPAPAPRERPLRRGQRLGKYKILRALGEGGFARVYAAADTLEGVQVALKIPYGELVTQDVLDSFRSEVRLAARLDHPHILGLKTADFIDGKFVAVTALGEESLGERLTRRLATSKALGFAEQALSAVAYAHEQGVIHCDIKPDNFIVFDGTEIRLTDFGLAKIALGTVLASGSGTVGFLAPEQAMGKPSRRSDVFSLGLLIFKMLSGRLPEWPFDWPPAGHRRLRAKVGDPVLGVLEKAIAVDPRKRYPDAGRMLEAFRRARRKSERRPTRRSSHSATASTESAWRDVRRREFKRRFAKVLAPIDCCTRCSGAVSEAMTHCPWCGLDRSVFHGDTRFPSECPRCRRGMKLDWTYCPWCFGPGFEGASKRAYSDRRYSGRCANPGCTRKSLMPFMRYCPWCRRKVRKPWRIPGSRETCTRCHWGLAADYWSYCPWCGKVINQR